MSKLITWIRNYINMQEYSKYVDDDTKPHAVFYSVCQAFFHLFIARHKEFVSSKNGECKFIVLTYVINLTMTFKNSIFVFFFFRNVISSRT